MFTLLTELHFWGAKDEIDVPSTDFSAIRHHDKKNRYETIYDEGKRSYCEKLGHFSATSNKKTAKIKDFEEFLQNSKMVYCDWLDNSIFRMVLSSGMIINIQVNVFNCEIKNISFDNYLIGKLESEFVSDVTFLKSHILFTYNENIVTIIHINKPLTKQGWPEKLSKLDAHIQTQELNGQIGKCKISSNTKSDLIAIWRKYNGDEVHPWSPSTKEQDRANVHIYEVTRTKLELICYYQTEFDPVCVAFSTAQPRILNSVEQKTSSKGTVTVEKCTYEINKMKLVRKSVTSIPLQTQVCCHVFNPDDDKLVLGCIDGSVVLFDGEKVITHLVKASFIPATVSLNHDGTFILVGNEKSQFQFFDISLSSVVTQMVGENSTPSNITDLSPYFRHRIKLSKLLWSKQPEAQFYTEKYAQTDSMLLLVYDHGPLVILKLTGTSGLLSSSYNMGFSPDKLIHEYLSSNKIDKAINVLLSLDWDFWGTVCLNGLNRIFNHLMRQPFSPEVEVQLQRALSSFHVPSRPMCQATKERFEGRVHSISRRFFHLLIRYQLFEKAFCLAIDIGDHDLFMDMNYYAWFIKDYELAVAAKNKALELMQMDQKFAYFNN